MMQVLLVEDDDTTRRLLAAQLRADDAQVMAVDSSEAAAIVMWACGPPDVIVADINLPGVSGLEFTSSLRAELGPERLGVVLISGDDAPTEVGGADTFLAKPFRRQDLLTAVHVARPNQP
jgi:CheY-like chemotaxis protein